MIKPLQWLVLGGMVLLPSIVRAEVVDDSATGFKIKHVVSIAAPADKVYRTLVDPGAWWDPEHTYSGKAANLRLEPRAGGCWCETLPDGGGVAHMTVVNVAPNKRITLSGALGPLQTAGVAGAMTWLLAANDAGTDFTLVYNVGGYAQGGLNAFAAGVDSVLQSQVARLKRAVETGSAIDPAASKTPATK